MRQPARIQAAIELLDAIDASLKAGGAAADVIVKAYFRARRFAGSKDRAAITELVFANLRRHAEMLWRAGEGADARTRMIAYLAATDQNIDESFDGSLYAPPPLADDERQLVERIKNTQGDEGDDRPDWVSAACPPWMLDRFRDRFGDRLDAEMAALQGRAPLDLRVNLLATNVEDISEELEAQGLAFEPGAFASTSFRILKNIDLSALAIYASGKVEVQDQGAQIASALCGAQPGQQVADLCAGAGGKTLALAADMANQGSILAFDTVAKRLAELNERSHRAGAQIITTELLPTEGARRAATLQNLHNSADLVVLDVPCSGTGTWRRNPESRWRLTAQALQKYCEIQKRLLGEGAMLVRPGGRLAYITCSLLLDEDEDQITAFLEGNPGFRLTPYRDVWGENLNGLAPQTLSVLPECLCLSPGSHATDGFFVALLEKI